MPFAHLRPFRVRSLTVPAVLICVILLLYFTWFDSHTRPQLVLVPVPSPPQSETTTTPSLSLSPPPIPKPPRILLVSALFPLSHSKHSQEDYRAWLAHFLGPTGVHSDLYFYTTPALASLILSLAPPNRTHTLTLNTTYPTPFSIPPLAAHEAKYTQMHAWDRERARHSPELYAVWNAKPWLLERALGDSGVEYDYAFWTDAGSFRTGHAYRAWPDPGRVEEVFKAARREMGGRGDPVFFPLETLPGRREYAWTPEMGPVDVDFSEGSFFGSTPAGIAWYTRTFYAAHDHYISTAPPPGPDDMHPHAPPKTDPDSTQPPFHFVGKDQTLINAIMFQHPSHFFGVLAPLRTALIPPSSSAPGKDEEEETPYALTLPAALTRIHTSLRAAVGQGCAVDWYYYQWWLASEEERRATERVRGWSTGSDGTGWLGWLGLGQGTCWETRVVGVEGVLRGLFGRRWVEERRVKEVNG